VEEVALKKDLYFEPHNLCAVNWVVAFEGNFGMMIGEPMKVNEKIRGKQQTQQ